MKRMFSVFLLITVWLLVTPFLQAQSHVDKVLKDEITSDLKENILSFWERYSVDSSGGFYGSLGRDGAPIADAPKGGVLNARILWTFSTAYRMYGDTAYRKLAFRFPVIVGRSGLWSTVDQTTAETDGTRNADEA